jgi:hypothetical protein
MHFSTIACRVAAHPLKTVFVLALLVRLINLAFLAGNEPFFVETDGFAYWKLGAQLARAESFWSTLLAETDRMPFCIHCCSAASGTFSATSRELW